MSSILENRKDGGHDEANCAVHARVFGVEELLKLIDLKPSDVELVIASRADLVMEMTELRHHYYKYVPARN